MLIIPFGYIPDEEDGDSVGDTDGGDGGGGGGGGGCAVHVSVCSRNR